MANFGWSYPPGAASDPFAPYNQPDPPCEVCFKDPAACVCPECPHCQEQGNPACYDSSHGLYLKLTRDQAIARIEERIRRYQDQLDMEKGYLHYVQTGGTFCDDLNEDHIR